MEYELVITQKELDMYSRYYFRKHPKAHVVPIKEPYHPSINKWFIMQRQAMNNLKQKWKDFTIWLCDVNGYRDLKLETFTMSFTTYMPTKRRIDPDNTVPKFILDGFVEAGFIVDDDGTHLKSLELKTDYDKENPRTVIIVKEV